MTAIRQRESVCAEADRLDADRRSRHGHPLDDLSEAAELLNVVMRERAADGWTAEDVALVLACVELARCIRAEDRSHLVGLCEAANKLQDIKDERKRRDAGLLVRNLKSGDVP